MPVVTFQPSGNTVEVAPGCELLEAARRADVTIQAPCGSKGTCGKCIVRIVAGSVDSDSLGLLSRAAAADGQVLACRTHLLDVPVTVLVPEATDLSGGQFGDSGNDAHLIRRELLPDKWEYNPLAVKWLFEVAPPRLEDGLSDLDRLSNAIQQQWGKQEIDYPLPVIRTIGEALRADQGRVTVALIRDAQHLHVVGIDAGDTTASHYGVAVDIGTTTVAAHLVFLPLATIIGTRSEYNDQISCGLDVISRINYARRPERLEELRGRVVRTINRVIEELCATHGVKAVEVCNMVVSGNTTMIHLLLGLPPESIRLEPYTPTVLNVPHMTVRNVGLAINPDAWICFSPCVGSYIGGDITAGILCTDLAIDTEEVNLFIDIGTNGEIVLGNCDFLLACACSAGPAFEGGGIGCGMRAALGAIERVEVDPETGTARYSTIGNVQPTGICGSGMIQLLAELFTHGWIDPAGKLDRERPSPAIEVDGRHARYLIVPATESAAGEALAISEPEIDNIIRAKAAIYSACALMLKQVGLGFEDLAKVYIAGGFGRYLDLEKATTLGLVPDLPQERFHYLGNASLMGSYLTLVSQEYRDRQMQLANRMTYMELSTVPAYLDQYTAALFIPHTDPLQFPSVGTH